MYRLDSQLTNLHGALFCGLLITAIDKNQVTLNSGKNIGHVFLSGRFTLLEATRVP
jgi:hypothetical protein